MLKPLTIAAVLSLTPTLALAQFGGFVPQAQSVQAMADALSSAAQSVRDARPVVNEATAIPVSRLSLAEARNRLAMGLASGGVSVWSLELGREIRRVDAGSITALALSGDGATLATASPDGAVQVWDAARGRRLGSIAGTDAVKSLALSDDGSRVLIVAEGGSRLVAVKDGRELARLAGNAALHPTDELVAVADGAAVTLSAPGGAKPLWRLEGGASRLAFSADGTMLVAAGNDGAVRLIDTAAGQVKASLQTGFAPTALSVGYGAALVGGQSALRRIDLADGSMGAEFTPHPKGIADAVLLRDGALVLSASPDFTTRLGDAIRPAEPLAQVVMGRDGWAVVAMSGEFDAEADGMDAVKWAADKESFALEQFADGYFQPGILPRLLTRGETEWRGKVSAAATRLAGERAEKARVAAAEKAAKQKAEQDRLARAEEARKAEEQARAAEEARRQAEEQARIAAENSARVAEEARKAEEAKKVVVSKEFAMPPKVAFDTPKAETSSDAEEFSLAYSVEDLGGGVDEVRLYQNGKLVSSQTARVAEDGFKARLAQGANEFRLVALSRDRIESRPAKVKVTYTGAERKSTLHVVAIGINNYKNPALNLNYGAGDAKGIADYFTRQPKTLYQDVVLHTLYDDKATKANIVALLESLKNTKPEDSVIIYLAGHGDTLGDNWYFMPTEVRYPEREDEVRERGLPSAEINARIKEMGAQKVLMLVDACKSGAALVAFRGFEDRKALMQVARASGVHVVAAAGKDQFAAELTQLGHGLFTYTLLEGLSGKADRKQAHTITVRGLTNYVEDQLPELSQSYKGVAQFPVVDSRGMDFPVATY